MTPLYLEPQEEITSVIDKIKTLPVKEDLVVLVMPQESPLTGSLINLKLLLKEARRLDKKIAIVTGDTVSRNLASRLGIPVFSELKEVEVADSQEETAEQVLAAPGSSREVIHLDSAPSAKPPSPEVKVHHYNKQLSTNNHQQAILPGTPKRLKSRRPLILLTASVFLIFFILLLLLAPATIDLTVASQATKQTYDIILPAEKIISNQEAVEKFSTTGEKEIGEKASGAVTVYNFWDSSNQEIPANSTFVKDGKIFVSKQAVSVPGTSIKQGNQVPGTATVTIIAEKEGGDYNVAAGRFTIADLPVNKQDKIYGQTTSSLSGGSSKKIKIVSSDDQAKARQQLSERLFAAAKEDLVKKSAGKQVLDKAIDNQITTEIISKKVDSEADDFQLTLTTTSTVLIFQPEAFNQAVTENLRNQLPLDKELILDTGNETSVEIGKQDTEKLQIQLTGQATTRIAPKIDLKQWQKKTAGQSKNRAEKSFSQMVDFRSVKIQTTPRLWPRLPLISQRVNIKIHYE